MEKINLYIFLPLHDSTGEDIADGIIRKYAVDDEKSSFSDFMWCVVTDNCNVGCVLDEIDRDIRCFVKTDIMYVFAHGGFVYTNIEDKDALKSISDRYVKDNGHDCEVVLKSVSAIARKYPSEWLISINHDTYVLRFRSNDGTDAVCRAVAALKLHKQMWLRYDSDAAYIYWENYSIGSGRATMASLILYVAEFLGPGFKMDFWYIDSAEYKLYTSCTDSRENDRVLLRYARPGVYYFTVHSCLRDMVMRGIGL